MHADKAISAAQKLSDEVSQLAFELPTAYVYNPLEYAWAPHKQYLQKHAQTGKKVIFLGMNPGPFGMAQTGVPFGEIPAVRDWIGVQAAVTKPDNEHPKREITGFECTRSEVSGRRLWGLFAERFGPAENFFKDHFVANYCPLVFMEDSGRNRTPDKLPASESQALYQICNAHLKSLVEILSPDWVIGVGAFAQTRAQEALVGMSVKIGRVLHPSPASPAANKDWAGTATKQLIEQGIWE